TIRGIDLNHDNVSSSLPEELGLLTDLALFHLNSNRFCGTLSENFRKLHILYELDDSNNLFIGNFPYVVISLPTLKFLDIRYNGFDGDVPSSLFDLKLDNLFINNKKFWSSLSENFGDSPMSVVVYKENGRNLNEIILLNVSLMRCLPSEIGLLENATMFDVGFNLLVGILPETMKGMRS
ncbi:hypothetical protein U1Q18_044241, partial [Sarracenia purpurea var. burkii]